MLCPIKQQCHNFLSCPFAVNSPTAAVIVLCIPHQFHRWPSSGLHSFISACLDDAPRSLPGTYTSQLLHRSCLHNFCQDLWSSSYIFIAGRSGTVQNIQDRDTVDLYNDLFLPPFFPNSSWQLVCCWAFRPLQSIKCVFFPWNYWLQSWDLVPG